MAIRNSDGTFTLTSNEIRDLMNQHNNQAPAVQDDDCDDTNDTSGLDRGMIRAGGRLAQAGLTVTGHPLRGQAAYNDAYKTAKTLGYKSNRRPIASATCESFFNGDADKMYRTFHPIRSLFNDLF